MLTKADEKLIHALQSRRGREKHGLFLVEGVRVAEDLVASGIDLEFAVVSTSLGDNERGQQLIALLSASAPVKTVSDKQLADIAETETPQGVLIVARIPQPDLSTVTLSNDGVVLVLDAIQDPGNLGTLIRSADAFGAEAVIALPGTTDYWGSKVVRSTAGAAFRMPLINGSDDETWQWLASNNVAICGADMQGEPIADSKIGDPVALVVGNEGGGLRAATRERLTHLVTIPMPGNAESLNVAVAAGILLYEFSKQRR